MMTDPWTQFKNIPPWLSGSEETIAVSSRIRIARNLKSYSFPIAASPGEQRQVLELVRMAVDSLPSFHGAIHWDMAHLDEHSKQLLLERRLISRNFISGTDHAGLTVLPDESLSLMINEEDHLRLQSLRTGFQLQACWEAVHTAERGLDAALPLAYDSKYGYLTSCPTNVGTGLRASVMLHLPALVMTDQIPALERSAGKLGLSVRGMMGEGSGNIGNLYQISNQSTLGEREPQIIERLEAVIRRLIEHELLTRRRLQSERGIYLMNQVGRAFGVLKYAYLLKLEEALNLLSFVRLGVEMGMFSAVTVKEIQSMWLRVQPAHLLEVSEKKEPENLDMLRALWVREHLRQN